MKMEIEKGIELPQRFPFSKMEVGDSFAVPADIKKTIISTSASVYGRRNGKKFSVRKDALGQLRCWRVK